ncbi:MAG: chemotaxis protein CheW [Candidatus Binatia bacterium]
MKDDFTLLTFTLDQVWYAINVQEVQEVVPLPELTPLTDAPPFVSGIFNLRGHIVTTIDLRQRMGLRRRPWDIKNAVLIVPFQQRLYGLIVDEALSLIKLSAQDMEPAPDLSSFMGNLQSQFVIGVGKLEGRLIPILNLNRIFTIVEPQELGDWQVKEDHE